MRIGLVGVGRIGIAHATTLRAHPAVSEVVIADADPGRAATAAERLGLTTAETVDKAFHGVDAVVLAAPTAAHEELIRTGVRAGLPVFCEKPVAPDIAGTLRVRDEVARAGIPVQIGFQRRFDAGYTAARRALHGGTLGTLHRVHLVTADPEPPSADYIATSGGIFRDCHVHDFDVLRWVTGREVTAVYAVGSNRGAAFFARSGDVDNAAALLRLDDDTLVTLQGSRYNGAGYDVRMELAGTVGTHVVGLDDRVPLHSSEEGVSYPPGPPWPSFRERFAAAYDAEMRAFVNVVTRGLESPCTVDEAVEALYVAEAADLSLRERRPVTLEEVRR